jgi:hypothetical protein
VTTAKISETANIFRNLGGLHEIPSASRPRRGQAYRRRREDDRVLFGKWSGTEVKLDGQELLIMKESDIMGVLTDYPVSKKKAA